MRSSSSTRETLTRPASTSSARSFFLSVTLVLVLFQPFPPPAQIDLDLLERLRPHLLVRVEHAELEPLSTIESAHFQVARPRVHVPEVADADGRVEAPLDHLVVALRALRQHLA